MTKVLLSIHVLAAILTIGPVAVAASRFPPAARAALSAPDDVRAASTVTTLYRICRVYSVVALFVPAFGLATGASLGVLTDVWLLASIALTVVAAVVLVAVVLPTQRELIAMMTPDAGPASTRASGAERVSRLAAGVGMFNLLWAVVVVLMIVRPGSTTGVE